MTTRVRGQSGPRTVSYLRVSTSQQDTEKNKRDVAAFANTHDFPRVQFTEETVSGVVSWKERGVKELIDSLREGDRLIVPELSRLGRSTLEIMEMLAVLKEKKVSVYDVKNGWELNGSLQSEIMAFCFSIAARGDGMGDVAHNHHNSCPPREFFRLMAIAMAEAPTPNLLAISAIEIPVSRLNTQAISALALDTLLLWPPD